MNNSINITWYGYLGNNIQQLAGSIFYAKCCEGDTIINPRNHCHISHYNLINQVDPQIIVEKEYDIDVKVAKSLYWNTNSYYNHILDYIEYDKYYKFLENNIIKTYRNIIYEIISKSFNFSAINIDQWDLENSLVIHLRSGDIIGQNAHTYYIQSPWTYFKKILEKVNPKKVILCTGNQETEILDKNKFSINPCYDKIVSFCNENGIIVDCKIRTQQEDVYILSNAKKIVVGGISSFSAVCIYMNKKNPSVYYPLFFDNFNDMNLNPYYYFKLFDNDINTHYYKFEGYYEMGKWKYDLKTMIEFPENKINEVLN